MQTKTYLEEAKLSIETVKVVLKSVKRIQKHLWHAVVKSSYEAMEQAILALPA